MSNEVSLAVLEGTVPRALQFLRAAATHEGIHGALRAAGYSKAEHDAAWEMLHRVSGYKKPLPGAPSADKEQVRQAILRLDSLNEVTLERIDAPLKRLHPEQHAFVFDGLAAAQGAGSVLTVGRLCDRLDALEGAPEREATRAADQAALATLAGRGITSAFRAELRGLVQVASSFSENAPPPPVAFPDEQQLGDLKALRQWYVDWSQTAKAVVVRRDWLIRLGLAKRKKSARGEQPEAAVVNGSGTE